MTYTFRYSTRGINDLLEATTYYLTVHPDRDRHTLHGLAERAFVATCALPHAAPIRQLPGESILYRRVTVWRFAFLYRIDEETKSLIIDRIYHEASDQ